MTYALLKTIHLLGIVAWVGGMFFAHVCLRPALATLDAPTRLRLMSATLRRFFTVVSIAASLVLATGIALIVRSAAARWQVGLPFNMPLDWYVMAVVGIAMVGIYANVRLVMWKRLERAVSAEDWPAGARALASIRGAVLANLVLGVFVIAFTRLGATG